MSSALETSPLVDSSDNASAPDHQIVLPLGISPEAAAEAVDILARAEAELADATDKIAALQSRATVTEVNRGEESFSSPDQASPVPAGSAQETAASAPEDSLVAQARKIIARHPKATKSSFKAAIKRELRGPDGREISFKEAAEVLERARASRAVGPLGAPDSSQRQAPPTLDGAASSSNSRLDHHLKAVPDPVDASHSGRDWREVWKSPAQPTSGETHSVPPVDASPSVKDWRDVWRPLAPPAPTSGETRPAPLSDDELLRQVADRVLTTGSLDCFDEFDLPDGSGKDAAMANRLERLGVINSHDEVILNVDDPQERVTALERLFTDAKPGAYRPIEHGAPSSTEPRELGNIFGNPDDELDIPDFLLSDEERADRAARAAGVDPNAVTPIPSHLQLGAAPLGSAEPTPPTAPNAPDTSRWAKLGYALRHPSMYLVGLADRHGNMTREAQTRRARIISAATGVLAVAGAVVLVASNLKNGGGGIEGAQALSGMGLGDNSPFGDTRPAPQAGVAPYAELDGVTSGTGIIDAALYEGDVRPSPQAGVSPYADLTPGASNEMTNLVPGEAVVDGSPFSDTRPAPEAGMPPYTDVNVGVDDITSESLTHVLTAGDNISNHASDLFHNHGYDQHYASVDALTDHIREMNGISEAAAEHMDIGQEFKVPALPTAEVFATEQLTHQGDTISHHVVDSLKEQGITAWTDDELNHYVQQTVEFNGMSTSDTTSMHVGDAFKIPHFDANVDAATVTTAVDRPISHLVEFSGTEGAVKGGANVPVVPEAVRNDVLHLNRPENFVELGAVMAGLGIAGTEANSLSNKKNKKKKTTNGATSYQRAA